MSPSTEPAPTGHTVLLPFGSPPACPAGVWAAPRAGSTASFVWPIPARRALPALPPAWQSQVSGQPGGPSASPVPALHVALSGCRRGKPRHRQEPAQPRAATRSGLRGRGQGRDGARQPPAPGAGPGRKASLRPSGSSHRHRQSPPQGETGAAAEAARPALPLPRQRSHRRPPPAQLTSPRFALGSFRPPLLSTPPRPPPTRKSILLSNCGILAAPASRELR